MKRTHCRKGHELTDENTYVSPAGGRQCRVCKNDRSPGRTRTATHCARGHELVGNNIRIAPGSGARSCQLCNRKRANDRYEREHPGHRKAGQPRTHCKRGHAWTDENVYITPAGNRQCRICKAATSAEYNKTHGKRNRERYAERIADYMRGWHKRNREHEAEYRKQYRPRALELRRAKYAEDYAKPERRAKRQADRERRNEKRRERERRNKGKIRARRVERDRQIAEAIGTPQTGHYTPAEDAVVLRDDITVVEKCFILQRTRQSVTMRKNYLSETTQARLKRQRGQLSEYNRNYREANRERLAEQSRAYREANREQIAEQARQTYAADPEKRKAEVRKWQEANPDKVHEYKQRYRQRKRSARQRESST